MDRICDSGVTKMFLFHIIIDIRSKSTMLGKILFFVFYLTVAVSALDCSNDTRSYDGTCNNLKYPTRGSAMTNMVRSSGFYRNSNPPNERAVSNALFATGPVLDANGSVVQEGDTTYDQRKIGFTPEKRGLNAISIIFGQFISHDFAFQKLTTFVQSGAFSINITGCTAVGVPDELCSTFIAPPGFRTHLVSRSSIVNGSYYDLATGSVVGQNFVPSYLDLNTVYGPNAAVNSALRTGVNGQMKTDPATGGVPQRSLDANLTAIPNDCDTGGPPSSALHAAGDLRVDENGQITLLHILFLKEHNRLANLTAAANPSWTDEQVFQKARNLNIAGFQKIVYSEYLPTVYGKKATKQWLGDYYGYDQEVDASVTEEFDIAAYRLHTMLNLPLLIVNSTGSLLSFGSPAVFGLTPVVITPNASDPNNTYTLYDLPYKKQERGTCEPTTFDGIGAESMLRGSLRQNAQEFDLEVTSGIRSLRIGSLKTTPGNVDVESSNLFRGREHGIADFDTLRSSTAGFPSYYTIPGTTCIDNDYINDPVSCFQSIGASHADAITLRNLYGKLRFVDAFVGLMAERHAFEDYSKKQRSSVGETSTKIILDQFGKARDGDRFFYQRQVNEGGLLHHHEIKAIDDVDSLMTQLLATHFPGVASEIPTNPFQVDS